MNDYWLNNTNKFWYQTKCYSCPHSAIARAINPVRAAGIRNLRSTSATVKSADASIILALCERSSYWCSDIPKAHLHKFAVNGMQRKCARHKLGNNSSKYSVRTGINVGASHPPINCAQQWLHSATRAYRQIVICILRINSQYLFISMSASKCFCALRYGARAVARWRFPCRCRL